MLPSLRPSALAGLVVLVVEDSQDSRESLRESAELLGARVSVAGDGREALAMIGEVDPDLVLCDLRMPHMDGYEFIDEFSRAKSIRHPPVLAMSNSPARPTCSAPKRPASRRTWRSRSTRPRSSLP